nr:hypothetical protein [Bauldia sp.]
IRVLFTGQEVTGHVAAAAPEVPVRGDQVDRSVVRAAQFRQRVPDQPGAGGFHAVEHHDTGEVVGSGRVNIPFGPAWNETLEVAGLAEFRDDGYTAIGVFGHTFYKTQQFAAGFVLGGSKVADDGIFTAGLEGAVFAPTTTWTGLVAYNWGSGGTPDYWLASGEVRLYLNPNTKLNGIVTYADVDSSWMLTAGMEHRFDGTQFSLFGTASYFPFDGGNAYELLAGGRWFFDQPGQTLQGHDNAIPFSMNRAVSF